MLPGRPGAPAILQPPAPPARTPQSPFLSFLPFPGLPAGRSPREGEGAAAAPQDGPRARRTRPRLHLQILPRRFCSTRTSSPPPSWAAIAPAPPPAQCTAGEGKERREEREGREGKEGAAPPHAPGPLRPAGGRRHRPRGAAGRRRAVPASQPGTGTRRGPAAAAPLPQPVTPTTAKEAVAVRGANRPG